MSDDEKTLRYLLWLRHGCEGPALYGDDGEMQCSRCWIDFKRDSAESIQARFQQINLKKLADQQKSGLGCKRCGRPTFGPICGACKGE